jgi:hypothetical protein
VTLELQSQEQTTTHHQTIAQPSIETQEGQQQTLYTIRNHTLFNLKHNMHR